MQENNWVGVCCEPNAVFVVCNQFPVSRPHHHSSRYLTDHQKLIAVRLNDVRDGKNTVSGILERYKAAVTKHGMINEDSLYTSFFALKQQKSIPARHGAHTAW